MEKLNGDIEPSSESFTDEAERPEVDEASRVSPQKDIALLLDAAAVAAALSFGHRPPGAGSCGPCRDDVARLTVTERVWTSPAVMTLKKDTIVKQQADVEATVTETLVTSNAAHQKANEVHTIDPLNKPDERLARQAVKLTSLHESVFRTKESGVTRGATHMRNELASMAIDRSRRLENEKRIAAMRDDLQADNEDSRAEDELAATLIEIEKRDEDWRRMLHDK